MAETTADVRRDIELTRERMSGTIQELEQKLNLAQMVRDHPWPALALAVGAGVLLSGSRADVKAAAATAAATKGASSKIGSALDDVVAQLVTAAQDALQGQVDSLMGDVKTMLGAQQQSQSGTRGFADTAAAQGAPVASNATGYGVGPIDALPDSRPSSIPRAD
jgi:hypothetical protein